MPGILVGMDQKDSYCEILARSGAALGQGCSCARFGATTVGDQTVLKTVEVPQLQFLYKVVDVPVLQIFVVWVQLVDKVVAVPVLRTSAC